MLFRSHNTNDDSYEEESHQCSKPSPGTEPSLPPPIQGNAGAQQRNRPPAIHGNAGAAQRNRPPSCMGTRALNSATDHQPYMETRARPAHLPTQTQHTTQHHNTTTQHECDTPFRPPVSRSEHHTTN